MNNKIFVINSLCFQGYEAMGWNGGEVVLDKKTRKCDIVSMWRVEGPKGTERGGISAVPV